ncbi:uncharacterized protein LOC126846200 [Adelges cooleyi]|uniref:uncharacterized protein LOC126846200 n=1 Tax=Adelges cooleyi TaxID=133065 RepID=UPI00218008E3|nr:uncharacterized protein LOC126846200 [Adelges cooleyi]
MNLFCFLITFVLSNVLADELTKYKEAVFNTNAAIKHAYNINDFIDKDHRKANGPVYSVSLFEMCRLIGIYMSTKFPTSYIQTMEIDLDDKNCIMNDGTTEIRFKEINGEWWQISPDNDTVRQLEAHLR